MEYFTEAFEEHTQLAAKIAIVLVAYVIYRQDSVVIHIVLNKTKLIYSPRLLFRVWMEGPKFPKRFSAAGKVIIVTGAASGIGKETAMEMAERGGRVILACRNKDTAIATRDAIVAKTGNVDVHFMYLDLNSLNSVRSFVQEFLQQNKRLDLLINNASIIGTSKHLSDDGLDMHMAVNHYGTFLLTSLLLDILKTSVPSRIVTVSSAASERAVFCKEYIETQKTYGNNFQAYAQSKLANILFTRELSSHLRDTGVTANCVNPGACYSELAWQLDRFSLLRNR